MSDWSMGYRTDVLYTYGYYRELNPLFVKFVLTSQGYACPDFRPGACACELGFGQGVSINMHAMGSKVNWYGTDFNPSQVNFAREIAQLGAVPAVLTDDDFASFAQRSDLPDFDLIALHGIWSWISPENQDVIIDFVRRKLKVGGVLYISYNVSPGFMVMEPVRQLMREYDQELVAPSADADERVHHIAGFINSLLAVNPDAVKAVPILKERIAGVLGAPGAESKAGAGAKDTHYLIGEYLNTYWDISHFSTLTTRFDAAKVSFACSASPKDLLDSVNLSAADQQLLAPLKGKKIYETTRDFIVNRQFRRDYFIKGPVKLNAAQQDKAIDELSFILLTPPSEIKYTMDSRLGEARCLKFNHALLESAHIPQLKFLASPVLQGALNLSDIVKVLIQMYLKDPKISRKEMCHQICDLALGEGKTLNKDGKPITKRKEQEAVLAEQVDLFREHTLKLLAAMAIL